MRRCSLLQSSLMFLPCLFSPTSPPPLFFDSTAEMKTPLSPATPNNIRWQNSSVLLICGEEKKKIQRNVLIALYQKGDAVLCSDVSGDGISTPSIV